jgi:hypothetical protein
MPLVFRGPGMARRKTPAKDEERRAPVGRNSRVAFLLVTFLWPHKEKLHAAFRQKKNKTTEQSRLRNLHRNLGGVQPLPQPTILIGPTRPEVIAFYIEENK